jgi:hypothetical protein
MKHSAKKQQASSIRRWQDDREAILEFNRSITLIVDPSALTALIAARLSESFRAARIILLRAPNLQKSGNSRAGIRVFEEL